MLNVWVDTDNWFKWIIACAALEAYFGISSHSRWAENVCLKKADTYFGEALTKRIIYWKDAHHFSPRRLTDFRWIRAQIFLWDVTRDDSSQNFINRSICHPFKALNIPRTRTHYIMEMWPLSSHFPLNHLHNVFFNAMTRANIIILFSINCHSMSAVEHAHIHTIARLTFI